MTNYLDSMEEVELFQDKYSSEEKYAILHENIPENYHDHKAGNTGCKKFTYIYQICWSIKFLRNELIHILK